MPANVAIHYALISREKLVLCDHRLSDVDTHFESTWERVLENVLRSKDINDKFSFDSGRYTYHAYISGNLVYLCVSEAMFDRNLAFNCLFELERQLTLAGLKERAQSAGPFALRSCFSSTMASVLSQYSSSDRLGKLESKVEEVTGVMRQNIDKVVQRGDALDNLTERSDLLAHSTTDFRVSATKLRKKLCYKNVKLWVILVIIFVILAVIIGIIIISVLAAEGKFSKKH